MMPPEFKALMERYCQLGRLLPDPDDIDEVHERADEIRLILEEMHSVQREIDRILDANRLSRNPDGGDGDA
jgi:hypothetical protein